MSLSYEELEEGLRQRGFVGIESMCSMGKCHLNNHHYILVTDGLVIYSSIPLYRSVKRYPNELVEYWDMAYDAYTTNIFAFDKLDKIIQIVDELKNRHCE